MGARSLTMTWLRARNRRTTAKWYFIIFFGTIHAKIFTKAHNSSPKHGPHSDMNLILFSTFMIAQTMRIPYKSRPAFCFRCCGSLWGGFNQPTDPGPITEAWTTNRVHKETCHFRRFIWETGNQSSDRWNPSMTRQQKLCLWRQNNEVVVRSCTSDDFWTKIFNFHFLH